MVIRKSVDNGMLIKIKQNRYENRKKTIGRDGHAFGSTNERFAAATPTPEFFRANSGFFFGELFDLLESFIWDYLVKVKLKNLEKLLAQQTWQPVEGSKDIAICEFAYKASGWSKIRVLKAMRSVKEYVQVEYLGEKQLVSVYQYVRYASNLDLNAAELHELYKQRSTSETWIEQVKGHAKAGSTLTGNFWANDIFWQLNVLVYNL